MNELFVSANVHLLDEGNDAQVHVAPYINTHGVVVQIGSLSVVFVGAMPYAKRRAAATLRRLADEIEALP